MTAIHRGVVHRGVDGGTHPGRRSDCSPCLAAFEAAEPDPDIANDVAWWRAECDGMRKRITELEAENADLRTQLAARPADGSTMTTTTATTDTTLVPTDLELVAARIRFPRRELQFALVAIRTVATEPISLPATISSEFDRDAWLGIIHRLDRLAGTDPDKPKIVHLARWFPEARVIAAFQRLAADRT